MPAAAELSIRMIDTGLVLKGRLVGQLSAGEPGLYRYQGKFEAALTLSELAGIVETHIR